MRAEARRRCSRRAASQWARMREMCRASKPRGRWVRAVWRRSQRSSWSTISPLRLRAMSVEAVNAAAGERVSSEPAMLSAGGVRKFRRCDQRNGNRRNGTSWGGACDREPGVSIGHALRRRCGDAEGVLSRHRRDGHRIAAVAALVKLIHRTRYLPANTQVPDTCAARSHRQSPKPCGTHGRSASDEA